MLPKSLLCFLCSKHFFFFFLLVFSASYSMHTQPSIWQNTGVQLSQNLKSQGPRGSEPKILWDHIYELTSMQLLFFGTLALQVLAALYSVVPASDIAPNSRLLFLYVCHLCLMQGVNKCFKMKRQQQIQGLPSCISLLSKILTHQVLTVLVALR